MMHWNWWMRLCADGQHLRWQGGWRRSPGAGMVRSMKGRITAGSAAGGCDGRWLAAVCD
jgi:hypothetical protein